jgi:hypothetical protein
VPEEKHLTHAQEQLLAEAQARPGVREAMEIFRRATESGAVVTPAAPPQTRFATGANR